MKELKFSNISVIYDDAEISKKKILLNNFIMYFGCIITVLLIFTTAFIIPENKLGTALGTVLMLISSLAISVCGAGSITLILKKLSPKHYKFITWLMKFRHNEFEFGLFNNKYIVQAHFPDGWKILSLNYFLNLEKSFSLNDEGINKLEPLQMFIDCTKDEAEVIIKNK